MKKLDIFIWLLAQSFLLNSAFNPISTLRSYLDNALIRACQKSDSSRVKFLIKIGANLDVEIKQMAETEVQQLSLLRSLIKNNNLEMALILVGAGAKIDSVDIGTKLIHFAATKNDKNALEKLCVSYVNAKDKYGRTPLHAASSMNNIEAMKILLDHGADVNAKDNFDKTPLHGGSYVEENNELWGTRTSENSVDTIKILLDRGADVNAKNKDSRTPLHEASAMGRVDVMTTLLERGADVDAKDCWNNTPLFGSCRFEMSFKLLLQYKAFIDAQDNQGRTLLHSNVDNNEGYQAEDYWYKEYLERIERLIKYGVNVNIADKEGNTALHIAARAKKDNREIITILLNNKALVNAQNNRGETPLHNILNSENAFLLVKNGAKVQAKDEYGNTILHSVSAAGNAKMINFCLKHGIFINEINNNKFSSLAIMIRCWRQLPKDSEKNQQYLDALRVLLQHNANLNIEESDWMHVFDIQNKNKGALKMMLEFVRLPSKILSLAQSTWFLGNVVQDEIETMQLLIDHGADINNNDGAADYNPENYGTPLHQAVSNAVSNRQYHLVKLLLQNNADPFIKNNNGKLPIALANKYISQLLAKYMILYQWHPQTLKEKSVKNLLLTRALEPELFQKEELQGMPDSVEKYFEPEFMELLKEQMNNQAQKGIVQLQKISRGMQSRKGLKQLRDKAFPNELKQKIETELLQEAVKSGSFIKRVQEYIAQGINLNRYNTYKETALMNAINSINLKAVKLLIASGAHVDQGACVDRLADDSRIKLEYH